MNFFGRAAVNPVAIGKVGEAARTLRIRAVALDAIGGKQVFTDGHCRLVFGNIFHLHLAAFAIQRIHGFIRSGNFSFVLIVAGPVKHAFVVAQTRVNNQIACAE